MHDAPHPRSSRPPGAARSGPARRLRDSTITSPKSTASRTLAETTYSATPQVHDGRFTAPFQLDGGGLLLRPVAATYEPQRDLASVRTQASATLQIAPFAPYVVGLGRVTITRRAAGVRPVRNLVAWVALAKSSDIYSCTRSRPPHRRSISRLRAAGALW